MENQIKDNDAKKRKYLIDKLQKIGFFKKKRKSSYKANEKRDYICEYSSDEVDLLLDTILSLKEEKNQLIKMELDFNSKRKDKNFKLYKSLFYPTINEDITPFLSKLYKIITKENLNTYNTPSVSKTKYIPLFRNIIRRYKFCNEKNSYMLNKAKYQLKIEKIINLKNSLKDNFRLPYIIKDKKVELLDVFIEKVYDNIILDAIIQLIVYDFASPEWSRDKRNKNYKILKQFLVKFREELNSQFQNNKSIKKCQNRILKNFFKFLVLRTPIVQEINVLSNLKKFPPSYIEFSPLDKEVQFLYTHKKIVEEYGYISISCENFLDLEIVKKNIDRNTGYLNLKSIEKELEEFKLNKTDKSEILYNKKRPKDNFDNETEGIMKFLKKFSGTQKPHLQAEKSLTAIILKNKKRVHPFNKTLKTLINHPKESELLNSIIRLLLTREIFLEKGIKGDEYILICEIQKDIENLFLMIYSFENQDKCFNLKEKFINDFFILTKDTFKNESIINISYLKNK